MSELQGERNRYTCQACAGQIVTFNIDEGVTPFMLACRATDGCQGTMLSAMYRGVPDDASVTHEWYRPTEADLWRHAVAELWSDRTMLQMVEHVRKGGLMIREAEAPHPPKAGLPFEPEGMDSLRSRYHLALEGPANKEAGLNRRYVFDCKDGMRVMVSREVSGDEPHIHISASPKDENSPLYNSILAGRISQDYFKRMAERRFREIRGDQREMHFTGFSETKGVPHWHIELTEPRPKASQTSAQTPE